MPFADPIISVQPLNQKIFAVLKDGQMIKAEYVVFYEGGNNELWGFDPNNRCFGSLEDFTGFDRFEVDHGVRPSLGPK